MKIEINQPTTRKRPYLAKRKAEYGEANTDNIFVIRTFADSLYASAISGYFDTIPLTPEKEAEEFEPLPSGTVITITQE